MRSKQNYDEAKLFYEYMRENWPAQKRIHVDEMRELHSAWISEAYPQCRSWRSLHETIKRCKGLKSRKRGNFSLTSVWSEPGRVSSVSNYLPGHNQPRNVLEKSGVDFRRMSGSNRSVLDSILWLFRQNRRELERDKFDVEICCSSENVGQTVKTINLQVMLEDGNADAKEASTDIRITNKSLSRRVQLRSCGLLHNNRCFTIKDDHNVSLGLAVVDIGCDDVYTVKCCFKSDVIGCSTDHLAFALAAVDISGREQVFHIVRRVRGRCTTNLIEEVRSKEPYVRRRAPRRRYGRNIEPGQQLDHGERLLRMVLRFEKYGTEDVDMMMSNGQPTDELIDKLSLNLEKNHADVFHHLLKVEEIQMKIDIRYYDMEGVTMNKVQHYFALKVPGLAEKRPSLLKGDRLYASLPGMEDTEFEGYVHAVRQDEVWLKFSSRFHAELYVTGMKVNIRFTFNRLPLQLQHRALDTQLPPGVLFPSPHTVSTHHSQSLTSSTNVSFYDRNVEHNAEQNAAVKHILSGISRPAPYIIFGPPGTGKTMTTVEAIRQVLRVLRGSRVLACAPSNSAADLVCQRLLNNPAVSKNDILRLNAVSRDERDIPQDLTSNCKYDLTFDDLLKYRVVVCTLVTAGKIVSAGVPRGHFTHVFIDECGHAVEPECLIPISGLLDASEGQLVLAGDPQQLGPVLRSSLAIEHGLQVSLLERLMKREVYQRHDNLPYDSRVVTKLLNNYRSHPRILDLPNRLFYDGELIASADVALRSKMCSWDGLVSQGFPLIFHGVVGEENQEANSPSFFNPEEIKVACDYLQKLKSTQGSCKVDMKKDVGVISPYRKQVQKLRRCLEKLHIEDVKVGSVEEFQGQERTVIIITTVRSNADHLEIDKKFNLGFLRNPKRFNVAITRAKALLIVIGNPNVLIRDKCWKQFLEYVNGNGGYKGCPFPSANPDDDTVLETLQELELHTTDAYQPAAEEESQVQQHIEPEWRGEH